MLVRLIYASRPSETLSIHELDSILSVSKRNNAANHLSGILVYGDHFFLQCLEGPRNEVNESYLRISRDPRHNDCMVLLYEHVDCRIFGQWAMGRIQYKAEASRLAKKYSTHGFLDPYAMRSTQAEQFMEELGRLAEAASKRSRLEKSLRTTAG